MSVTLTGVRDRWCSAQISVAASFVCDIYNQFDQKCKCPDQFADDT